MLSGWLSVSPGEVPMWRDLTRERPAAVLTVGEPMPSLAYLAARETEA